MAGLYDTVADDYARARPTYPSWWFSRLASLTPRHAVAWDAGTGNGQAAVALAGFYDRVIGTDVSEQQLRFAEKRPNVTYALTPTVLTDDAVDSIVGPEGSVDLVTVATAVHWFDLESFYSAVKRVLRKDGGVIAVWTYTTPRVSPAVDAVYSEYMGSGMVYMDPRSQFAFDEYKTLPFPFDPVLEGGSGVEGNPEIFEMEKEMAVVDFLDFGFDFDCGECEGRGRGDIERGFGAEIEGSLGCTACEANCYIPLLRPGGHCKIRISQYLIIPFWIS